MTGPAHAVVGDNDEPTSIPQTNVDAEALAEEKKLAKYSKTAEFKRLKEFMEARIQFYQRYLPNGQQVEGDPKDGPLTVSVPMGDMTPYWVAACIVTKEFQNVLNEYANAAEAVNAANS